MTAALLQMDALLARVSDPDGAVRTAEVEALLPSVTSLDEFVDGYCTIIYLFVTRLRLEHQAANRDVMEDVVPRVVRMLRKMPKKVKSEAIPTMTALMSAAAMQLSPSLWRRHFGSWAEEEMGAVEATALMLAVQINQRSQDDRAAVRLITEILASLDDGD